MKSGILITLNICFTSFLFSQQETPRSWFLKTDLVSYFPSIRYNTGKINLELEVPQRQNTALAYDLAYIRSYGPSWPSNYIFYSVEAQRTWGFMVGTEYKFYLGRRRPIEPFCLLIWPLALQLNNNGEQYTGLYVSAQAAYVHTWSRITHKSYELLPKPYTVEQVNPMFLVRLGFQSVSPRNIVVDQSLGVGVQYAKASPDWPNDPNLVTELSRHWTQGFFPIINYNLKVGLAH